MNIIGWAPALLLTFGLLILVCCLIVIMPRRGKYLRGPDYSVGRDVYREFKS